jgi:hypothetical protein
MVWIGRSAVAVLQDGVIVRGGAYTYFTGWYSSQHGIFKAELTLNEHTPAPPHHLFYNAKDVGIGVTGGYVGDEAELRALRSLGKDGLGVHVTLRKLTGLRAK